MSELLDSLVRASVRSVAPYVPGTTVEQARRRFGLERVVKLSSNENPLGTSPRAMAAIRELETLHIYVDDDYRAVRSLIAQRAGDGVALENVLLGHGSNELLAQLFITFTEPGDQVVMADPTFSLYRMDARLHGVEAVEVPLRDGVHDLDAMLSAVGAKTKMVIICDPNNPTGTQVEPEAFARFVQALPERVILVLDQAYREYMTAGVEGITYAMNRPQTIVLRTASKIYGLAAVRFGYAIAQKDMIDWLLRTRLPFNVSAPALAAVTAALGDDDFLRQSVAANVAGRAQLTAGFTQLGLTMYPSAANFVAVAVPMSATIAYEGLLKQGVIVRSGDGLRMPQRLRVTIGTQLENATFLAALTAVLASEAPR